MLGAVLLSDTTLPALIIDERLQAADSTARATADLQRDARPHGAGEPVDALTLVEHLKQNGDLETVSDAASVDLLAGGPAVGDVRQYARIVRENAMLRRLLYAAYEIQARSSPRGATARPRRPGRARPRGRPRGLPQGLPLDPRSCRHGDDQARRALRAGKPITGTASGFEDLDTITGGFQPGNLIILAARPSMGKCQRAPSSSTTPVPAVAARIDDLVGRRRGRRRLRRFPRLISASERSKVSAGLRSGVQADLPPAARLRPPGGSPPPANHPLLNDRLARAET